MYNPKDRIAIERLIALWALNECTLGGILHAIKAPFTGILVGGLSVLLITLIATHADNKWKTLTKALTIVLLIKASISPLTPIAAYFAVSFQALLGMILYSLFSVNQVSVIVLSIVTFLESALQKLITLTIVFGESLWSALDIYMRWVGKQLTFLPTTLNSNTLIYLFLGFYAVSGFVVGVIINKTIKLMQTIDVSKLNLKMDLPTVINTKKTHKKRKYFFLMLLCALLLAIFYFNNDVQGWQKVVFLVMRSLLILIIWYAILTPLLIKLFHKFLSKKRKVYQTEITEVLKVFPFLKAIIGQSWSECKAYKGFNRLSQFLARSIVYSLYFKQPEA